MKRILIVTASIGYGVGGSEKALMEMLDRMDTSQYEIKVLSMYEAPEHPYLNDKMQILYGCSDFLKMDLPFTKAIRLDKIGDYTFVQLLSKLKVSIISRKTKGDSSKMQWSYYSSSIKPDETYYDAVIGYGVGLATYYAVEKTRAKVKIAWLNTSIVDAHLDVSYCRKMYDQVDYVVTDSKNGEDRFKKLYPDFTKNVQTIRNVLNIEEIRTRGEEGEGFTDDFDGTRILSVGRLCEAKAFHFAVDAAALLKKKGYKFRWYIVGFGNLESKLREQISQLNLVDDFVLLGSQSNPYPFFKQTDIYVQTSIFEGSCITIEEAMAFCKPIVTTNFGAAYEKVIDGVNGFITNMDGSSIAAAVEELLKDTYLQEEFVQYQVQHPLAYDKEVEKLYKIIENGD